MFKRLLTAIAAFAVLTGPVSAQLYGPVPAGSLVNRAEMVKLALDSAGVSYSGSNCFGDVGTQWFAGAVCTAKARGFISGYPDGRFKPGNAVSFVEAAAIALRAHGVGVSQGSPWYRMYLEKLADYDAVPASVTNIFHPIDRGQVAEMLSEIRNGQESNDDDSDNDDDDDDDNDGDDIDIEISDGDDPVEEGDTIVYTIRVENNDNDDQDVDVTAFLDEDMTYVSSSDDGDLENGDEVQWEDFEIDEDSTETITLRVRLKDRADDGDTVRLRVEAGDAEATETTDIDDDSDDDDDDDDDDNDGDVQVSISDSSDEVEPGDEFEYRIRIENDGNDDERVDVVAFLDDEMSFVSASDSGDESGDEVEWQDILVREDASKTLTLRVRVSGGADDGDTLELRVEADDEEDREDTDVEDDDDDDDNDDDNDDDEDVAISITDSDDPVEVGDIITYRIKLTNDGNSSTRVDLRAVLDDGMSYTSSSDNGNLDGNDEVEWNDLRIDDDDSKTVLLTVRVNNTADDGDTLRLKVETESHEDTETTRVDD